MTRFFLDNREITSELPSQLGLAEVFQHMDQTTPDRHVLIKGISFDGQPLPMDGFRPELYDQGKLASVKEVHMVSARPADLALKAVDGFLDYLRKLPGSSTELIAQFRSNQEQAAYGKLAELMSSFADMLNLLNLCQTAGDFSLMDLKIEGMAIPDLLREFREIVAELVQSQEEKNVFMISDLLEFEFLPKAGQFAKVFEAIRPKLELKVQTGGN